MYVKFFTKFIASQVVLISLTTLRSASVLFIIQFVWPNNNRPNVKASWKTFKSVDKDRKWVK